MKVFMLGWEFPPHISGGLGTACYGLTKGLDELGVEVSFVLPTAVPLSTPSHVKLQSPSSLPQARAKGRSAKQPEPSPEMIEGFEHMEIHRVSAVLQPYATPEAFEQAAAELRMQQARKPQGRADTADMPAGTFGAAGGAHYDGDLMVQVHKYARLAVELARLEDFDVIHAHDWMTFPAGQAVAAAAGKPLLVHVHSTEFDRSGQKINQQIYEIERTGMHAAHRVICVSYLTRSIVVSRYHMPSDKVEVVYNAVQAADSKRGPQAKPISHNEKIVLFLGRVTMQKGPEYFLQAAKKVVEKYKKVRFVVAGSGDMIAQCLREVADLKLGRYVTFTGFLKGEDVDRVFKMADLYVMPSVSEPFGIAPLEAISHDVPVIISKQSGVSEVLTHVLKVDFWDINEMANKILAVLRHPPLQKTLRQHGQIEVQKLSWRDSAEKIRDLYAHAIQTT